MADDLDFSGGSFERPGFQQALAGVKAGELAGIIVYRWDRFGRNLKESLAMIEEIEVAGGRVISATGAGGGGLGRGADARHDACGCELLPVADPGGLGGDP